jgi:hypothetical protein
MKTYYLGVTILAVVGVSLIFSNYPLVIALVSLFLGIGYQYYYDEDKKDSEKVDEVDDDELPLY